MGVEGTSKTSSTSPVQDGQKAKAEGGKDYHNYEGEEGAKKAATSDEISADDILKMLKQALEAGYSQQEVGDWLAELMKHLTDPEKKDQLEAGLKQGQEDGTINLDANMV